MMKICQFSDRKVCVFNLQLAEQCFQIIMLHDGLQPIATSHLFAVQKNIFTSKNFQRY